MVFKPLKTGSLAVVVHTAFAHSSVRGESRRRFMATALLKETSATIVIIAANSG